MLLPSLKADGLTHCYASDVVNVFVTISNIIWAVCATLFILFCFSPFSVCLLPIKTKENQLQLILSRLSLSNFDLFVLNHFRCTSFYDWFNSLVYLKWNWCNLYLFLAIMHGLMAVKFEFSGWDPNFSAVMRLSDVFLFIFQMKNFFRGKNEHFFERRRRWFIRKLSFKTDMFIQIQRLVLEYALIRMPFIICYMNMWIITRCWKLSRWKIQENACNTLDSDKKNSLASKWKKKCKISINSKGKWNEMNLLLSIYSNCCLLYNALHVRIGCNLSPARVDFKPEIFIKRSTL